MQCFYADTQLVIMCKKKSFLLRKKVGSTKKHLLHEFKTSNELYNGKDFYFNYILPSFTWIINYVELPLSLIENLICILQINLYYSTTLNDWVIISYLHKITDNFLPQIISSMQNISYCPCLIYKTNKQFSFS